MQLTFGVPGIFSPNSAVTVTMATCSEGVSMIPKATVTLSVSPSLSQADLSLSQWPGAQAALLIDAADDQGNAYRHLLAGVIESCSAIFDEEDNISSLTVTLSGWPSSTDGVSFSRRYQFYQDQNGAGLASAVFIAAGGLLTDQQDSAKPKRSYEVQYGESDADFAMRVLGEDGIIFTIAPDAGATTSAFPDQPVSLRLTLYSSLNDLDSPGSGWQDLPYLPTQTAVVGLRRGVFNLRQHFRRVPTEITLDSAPPEQPYVDLRAREQAVSTGHQHIEVRTHVRFGSLSDGQELADQLQECAKAAPISFASDWPWVSGGVRALLQQTPMDSGTWVALLQTTQTYQLDSERGWWMTLTGEAIDADASWRAVHPGRPALPGLLRGVVLNASGQPGYAQPYSSPDSVVDCDDLGRVLVRILWESATRSADTQESTVRLRVMTPWAGHSAGFLALPRVGQEVVVSFVNGDPAWPVVLGCLYGATADSGGVPPWKLPDDQQWVGLGTRATNSQPQYMRLNGDPADPGVQLYSAGELDMNAYADIRLTAAQAASNIQITGGNAVNINADTVNTNSTKTTTQSSSSGVEFTPTKYAVVGEQSQLITQANTLYGNYNQGSVLNTKAVGMELNAVGIKTDATGVKIDSAASVFKYAGSEVKMAANVVVTAASKVQTIATNVKSHLTEIFDSGVYVVNAGIQTQTNEVKTQDNMLNLTESEMEMFSGGLYTSTFGLVTYL
jgi:uncharacterized protein involved in type VI secretion and phage assembly